MGGRRPVDSSLARHIASLAAFLAVALHLAFAALPVAAVAGSAFAAAICSPSAGAGTDDPALPSPMQHGACLLCAVCAGGTPPLPIPASAVAATEFVAVALAVLHPAAASTPQQAWSSIQPRAPPVLA
ncbi:MAG: DUF2946 family protein [Rhodospirillales bacterium]